MTNLISIDRIPQARIWDRWRDCVPFLVKGLKAATTSTLEEIAADVEAGTDTLWLVSRNGQPVAAFLTAVWLDDHDEPFLGVYGLGGEGVRDWADTLDATMQGEASRQGVGRVRFCGRRAWSRVLPAYQAVGAHMGHTVFERAL